MSRGATVTYVEEQSLIANIQNPQENDIAVIQSSSKTDALDTTHGSMVYQFINGAWDLKTVNRDNLFTDSSVTSNVTKIRKAHIEELRNFTNFLASHYAKRFGDKYYHTHNYSKASLWWSFTGNVSDEAHFAKIFFNDYDEAGLYKKWLTINFGKIASLSDESINDRVRFSFTDASNSVSPVLDIITTALRSYVVAYFEKDTQFLSTMKCAGLATFLDSVDVLKAITASTAKFSGSVTVEGNLNASNVDITGNIDALSGKLTVADLLVKNDTLFEKDLTVNGVSGLTSIISSGTISANNIVATGEVRSSNLIEATELRATSVAKVRELWLENPFSVLTAGANRKTIVSTSESDPLNSTVIFNRDNDFKTLNFRAGKLVHDGATIWTAGNDGPGSGLNADLLDGKEGTYYSQVADASAAHANSTYASDSALIHGKREGHHEFDGTGFNADRLDGKHADQIIQELKDIINSKNFYTIRAGTHESVGNTYDLFPSLWGKTMADVIAFMPTFSVINWAGKVDGNDSTYCSYQMLEDRIRVTCYTSEQRTNSQFMYIVFLKDSV